MQKKGSKKSGKSKKSSSSAKVANKKLNKFAKQGKLRKQRLKQKKKEAKNNKAEHKEQTLTNGNADSGFDDNESINQEDHDENVLDEEDIEFYTGQETAFAQRFATSILSR